MQLGLALKAEKYAYNKSKNKGKFSPSIYVSETLAVNKILQYKQPRCSRKRLQSFKNDEEPARERQQPHNHKQNNQKCAMEANLRNDFGANVDPNECSQTHCAYILTVNA